MASSSEGASAELTRLQAGLRLLQSLASRGSSEIAALLIPALLLWVSTRNSPAVSAGLAWWWGLMVLMALGFAVPPLAASPVAVGARLGAATTAGRIDRMAAVAGAGRVDQWPALGQRARIYLGRKP